MAVSDWSDTAASNGNVGGININENCPPGNLNDAIREVMAQIKAWYASLTSLGRTLMTSADAAAARGAISAAASGANADITSLQNGCTATTQNPADNSAKLATTAYADAAANAAVTASAGIGVGQTWQDVTGSRSSGASYTNSTGKPIQIVISASSGSGGCIVTVGSASIPIQIGSASFFAMSVASFIIPNGVSYSVSGSFSKWLELR